MPSVLKPLVPHEPEAGPELNLEIAVTVLGLTVRRTEAGKDVIVHKGKSTRSGLLWRRRGGAQGVERPLEARLLDQLGRD